MNKDIKGLMVRTPVNFGLMDPVKVASDRQSSRTNALGQQSKGPAKIFQIVFPR